MSKRSDWGELAPSGSVRVYWWQWLARALQLRRARSDDRRRWLVCIEKELAHQRYAERRF